MKKEGQNSPAAKQKPHKTPVVPPPGTALKTVVEEDQSMNKLLQLTIEKLDGEGAQSAVAVVKELVELQNKQEDRLAKREFHAALSEFQQECPQVPKTKSTPGASSAGSKFGFAYAPLNVVEKTIGPHLYSKGFSYYWDGETSMMGDKFLRKETCRLLHRNGYEISSSLSAPVTKEIGSMNDVQRFGAVQAYLKRYTLLAILGVPTADIDTDAVSPETLDEKEVKILKSKAERVGANIERFLEYIDVGKFEQIRKVDLSKAALALDMYSKKEPTETTDKPEKEKKPKSEPPADGELNKYREKAYGLLKQAADKKLVNRDRWKPIIKDAKSVENLNTIISNLSVYIDEGSKNGKLKL